MKSTLKKSMFGIALAGCTIGAFASSPTFGNVDPKDPPQVLALDDAATKSNSPGQFIDDAAVTTKVKAALIKDKTTKAHEIKVETTNGVVNLSGEVGSNNEIDRASEVARSISGVQSVQNDLKLKN